MNKKLQSIKMILVAVGLIMGTSAWAADKTVVKYSFDDAMSPSLTAGSRVSFDYDKTSVITSTKFLNAYNNTNGDPGSSTVSLGSTDLSGETWTLSFEWAACGGCNSKADHTILKAGDTNLFDLTGNSNWNTTVTITYAGSDGTKTLPVPGCDKGKRFSAATGDQLNTTAYWHHIVVTGSSDGVKMTITNSSSGTAVVENVVLSATNVNPTSLIIEPCCGGAIGIDELSLTYYVEGEVVQTPVANYSAVDGISRTITATCDTEGATLYYSTDGESWTEGASVTVSESGKVYFKAVKGTTESDVLEFDAEAGEAIVLNAPVIDRTSNTSVTISCDQTNLLLSPTATVYYTYGEESGSFTGSITLTVAADATITAYAEAEGYTTSETSERAVALFPIYVTQTENTAAKTSGWSAQAFSEETITASERTYAALMLDGVQWGQNVYLQTGGAWGLRANGNWYINSATDESWMLMQNMKKGDIIVANVTYPASSMVNATFSKYSYGTRQAYEVTEDGDVELAFKKPSASDMDYFYGVYAYTTAEYELKNISLKPAIWDVEDVDERYAVYGFNSNDVYDWFDFTPTDEAGVFTAAVPDFFKNIILVRMKGTEAENSWANKWNQTVDIDFTTIDDNTLFTITGWGEGDDPKSTYDKLNTYTATFTTNIGWEKVYAYVWSGDGDGAYNKALGEWGGTEITAADGKYNVSFLASNAPEKILFHNGNGSQTSNFDFDGGKTYTWNNYTVTFTTDWTNVNAWAWNVVGDGVENLCGEWPGTAMTGSEGVFTYTYTGVAAPDMILFNNGTDQTSDFTFEDGKNYTAAGPASVDKTITAAGYATYCSPYALDFSNTGLTAYIAKKGDDNKVTFTPVEKVPANTGVLLKGEAGDYTINTTTEATDNVTDNDLVGVTKDTKKDAGIFVLMNGTQGVGFYVTKNEFTVGANTAYLPALPTPETGEARTFIAINSDGTTTTGISSMHNSQCIMHNEVYNLNGQRVMRSAEGRLQGKNAKKGLYIVNGKKVIK